MHWALIRLPFLASAGARIAHRQRERETPIRAVQTGQNGIGLTGRPLITVSRNRHGEDSTMSVVPYRCAAVGLACALVTPASAQLLTRKDVSAAIALTIAQTAIATCTANGYRVSATVVGRNGEVLVQIRGDGTGPHTMENSFKKAYTARTFRIPSGEMEERLKKNPQMGAQYLTGFTTARGALPIVVGEEVIGAAGVSGAPGGDKDEACVKAGIEKVADQLK